MDEDELELELDPAFQSESLHQSLGGALGAELDGGVGAHNPSSAPRTPRRGGVANRQENMPATMEGYSLADELASAMSPAAQRRQNRMRMAEEYGLELDEEEEDGDEEEDADAARGQSFGGADASSEGISLGDSLGAELGAGGGHSLDAELGSTSMSSPARTPARSAPGDEELARQQEAAFSAASSAILDSVRTTDAFLARLRGLAGSSNAAESSKSASAGAATTKSKNTDESDTAALEESASALVRRLGETVKERERQVREVWEADRELSRMGLDGASMVGAVGLPLSISSRQVGGGGSGLEGVQEEGADEEAEEDALEGFGKEEVAKGWPYDASLATALEVPPTPADGSGRRRRSRHQQPSSDVLEDDYDVDESESAFEPHVDEDFEDGQFEEHAHHAAGLGDPTAALEHDASLPSPPSRPAPPSHSLAHLRLLNTSVLASLSALHEHVQVQRAAQSDAGRRLRSVRGVLAGWRAEWESADRSRLWIERYEGPESSASASASASSNATTTAAAQDMMPMRRPEDIRLWTRQQIERFERVLAEAEVRAQELLRPVETTALDEVLGRITGQRAVGEKGAQVAAAA